ncbi:hypothetical protein NEIG_02604 [Nematocida sp. ERTm5]|nr:hypothetical protein NEIG_02604 [Nematocida sp. ERTm5]
MGLEMRKIDNRAYEIIHNRCINWCVRKTKLILSQALYFIYLAIFLEQLYAIKHRVGKLTSLKYYTINNSVLGEVKIHVGGPLNLTRGCIYECKNVLLYKMRVSAEVKRGHDEIFKSPGWAADTIIKQSKCKNYVMVPNPLYTSKQLEYMKEYYNILFLMFQGGKKYASEFEKKTNRFYKFLSSVDRVHTKADHTLLASLFLLTEGLNIPLKFLKNNEYMHLALQKNQSNDFHFNFYREEINTSSTEEIEPDPNSTEENGVYLKRDESDEMYAYDIVNFFIKHSSNPVIEKAGYVEPKTYEEYKTRKFINSPGFLIQNYVYYYLDSIEEIEEFIKTVHDLLCEYLPDKEKEEMTSTQMTATRIFNRCFISSYNKNSIWEGVQLEKLSESIWNDIQKLRTMNTVYENSITRSLRDSEHVEIKRIKSGFAVLFNRTFIQYILNNCFFILAEKIRILETSDGFTNDTIQVEDFIKITEQKNLEFNVFCDNYRVNCTCVTIVTALFAKAIYNNLDKDHKVVQLAANTIGLSIGLYRECERTFIFAIVASIYEQSRESNPKIFLENNIYLMRNYTDTHIMNNVSFILTYLIYKNAPHAIIRFIKSYMVVRRKFNLLTLTNLILWHLSQTEAKNLLLCLTRNFTTTEYIHYAFMSVQKIEGKKSREDLVVCMNEFILLLHNIAIQNELEFKNIANESYIVTIQSSIKEISTPNTDQNTLSFLLNSMQSIDITQKCIYDSIHTKDGQIIKTLHSIYNRNTSEDEKLNLMRKIEGMANNIIYILNNIEEFYCNFRIMGALIACNPYVNTNETTKAQYNEIRDEFLEIYKKGWYLEKSIYTIFIDNEKKIYNFFKTLIDLGVDGALDDYQKFNSLYTHLVDIRKQREYKLEAEIFLQLFKMDDLKRLDNILNVLKYLHIAIYSINRGIFSRIQIITACTYRKERSIIPEIEEMTIKAIDLASKIHNEMNFQMRIKIIPGKTTGIDEIKEIEEELMLEKDKLKRYMYEVD